jgi:hypothetical protein
MDKKDLLKSVLQNFINDKPDDAKADFHQYLTLKSKEITGIGAQVPVSQQQESDDQIAAAAVASTFVDDEQVEPAATKTAE